MNAHGNMSCNNAGGNGMTHSSCIPEGFVRISDNTWSGSLQTFRLRLGTVVAINSDRRHNDEATH